MMKLKNMMAVLIVLNVFIAISCKKVDIYDAALNGDLGRVKSLLEKNPRLLNKKGIYNKEPLHFAAQGGHKEVVEFLISKGANVNCRNILDETPLHYAAGYGYTNVVDLLIVNNADINAIDVTCLTPLDYVLRYGKPKMVDILMKNGGKVYLPDLQADISPGLPLAEKFQHILEEGLKKCQQGMGISAAVIMPNRETWAGAAGFSEPGKSIAVTPGMLFNMASICKNFVAVVILQLVEEKKINLNDPIKKWLPEYKNIDGAITIQQLLNHTSGVYDYTVHPESIFSRRLGPGDFEKKWSLEEILSRFVDRPYFSPGSGWHYSSTNYLLLSMIVEKISHSTFAQQLRKRILNPLELRSTFSLLNDVVPREFQLVHNWYDYDLEGNPVDLMQMPKHGISTFTYINIYTSAKDLAKWGSFLFQGLVLKESTLKQMLSFHSPTPGEPYIEGYGLGVACGEFEGMRWWGHLGKGYGYIAGLFYLPDYPVTLAVMENIESEKTFEIIVVNLVRVIRNHLDSK